MNKKRLHPLAIIFIAAVACLCITFIVLYAFVGLRYQNDPSMELKFIGRVQNGVPVSGKLYYYDGRVGELDAAKRTIQGTVTGSGLAGDLGPAIQSLP